MPKPRTKAELLNLSHQNFQRLKEWVDQFSAIEQNKDFPEGTLNRNIRDVLAHLYEWHLLFQSWYQIGMTGGKPAIPAKGYTWKTVPDLNRSIWEKYHDTPLTTIRSKLQESHAAIQKVIQSYPEPELFEKKRFKWTGSTSLAAYLISASSSHYDWAYRLIKRAKK